MGDKKRMGDKNNTLRLYTFQSKAVCDAICRDGECFSREQYVKKKYGESAQGFLIVYQWFSAKAACISQKPAGAQLPYWAFVDKNVLEQSGDGRALALDVPKDEVILFNMYDYNRVIQLKFLGETPEDEKEFADDLKRRGISQFDAMTTNFYPEVKAAIMSSWDRLFKNHEALISGKMPLNDSVQAAMWRIKREWIANGLCT